MIVEILAGHYKGQLGYYLGAIPTTDWFNVLIAPNFRLVLNQDEFRALTLEDLECK